MKRIDLNCDMGEGIGNDPLIMPFITSANIACGYHAGDEEMMKKTIALCKNYGVHIGVHPSYLDRENFGRTDVRLHPSDVYELMTKQISHLKNLAEEAGLKIHHVKPHGALYNMAARNYRLAAVVALAVKDAGDDLLLYGLSGSHIIKEGKNLGLKVINEVFADRTYLDNGSLTPRHKPDAIIHDAEKAVAQVLQMIKTGKVTSVNGKEIPITAETICIHSDNENAVEIAKAIHQALNTEEIILGFE